MDISNWKWLNADEGVKVGLEAQSPAGDGGLRMGHDRRPADRNGQEPAGADPDDLEAPV